MRSSRMKPVTALIGSAFVVSLASASFADTGANPFGAEHLAKGYALVAEEAADDAKDDDKDGEGKCGEGACGEKRS